MGNAKSTLLYSKALTPSSDTETGIYRNPLTISSQELTHSSNPYILTLQDSFLQSVKTHQNKAFLGTRNENGVYIFKNYGEVHNLAMNLGSGLLNSDMVPVISEFLNYDLRFVGVFAKNREEILVCDLACVLFGFVSIALYDTFDVESLEFILKQTNLITIFCSSDSMEIMKLLKNFAKLQHIVCFDCFNDMKKCDVFAKNNIKLHNFKGILDKGMEKTNKIGKITPETIYTFCYTSGTTGLPKGVMLSHKNFISVVTGLKQIVQMKPEDTHLSYLPIAHVFERLILWSCISEGVAVGFYSGDVLNLKDDLQVLHPTIFASVPKLYNNFFESMKSTIEKLSGFKAMMARKGIASKLAALKKDGTLTHAIYDRMVFKKMKLAFGGKVRFMASGSAPISPEVIDFLKIANGCPIFEGYGQTESTGASFVSSVSDHESGHTGGPLINTEFKLRSVADMNYSVKEEPAMGEILIRGPGVFVGYYKDEERTKEVLDEEGWLHTGDIGMILHNGALKIIDRINNIFKLSQGEYIAAEKIETIYQKSKVVSEIFVYGDSFQSFIVAVIVPERSHLLKIGEKLKVQGGYEELCREEIVKENVLKELEIFGKANGLKGFEIVKNVYLEGESFGKKELVSSTFKLKRFRAREVYAKEIKEMYGK